MKPVERVLAKLPDAQKSKDGWKARCPAHDDQNPSLSVSESDDGRALVYCHAGCKTEAVCESLGLRTVDLMPTADQLPARKDKRQANGGKSQMVAAYDYRDENGDLLFQVVRFQPKDFRQRRPKPGGGWDWSVKNVRVLPYRLPQLVAEPTRPVFIVEGEKDADRLAQWGMPATCDAGGAGKFTAEHAEFFRGRKVVVLADNDDVGRTHVAQVAALLHGAAAAIRTPALPSLKQKGDVSDWIDAGGTKEALAQIVKESPDWSPTAEPWPKIESYDDRQLPVFPTECLPTAIRDWVEAEAMFTQTPADLPALLALAVVSAAIARRVVIEPRTDFREPVNLFVAILLEPGNRKSAVFSDATRPLRELEKERIEIARPLISRQQSDRRQDERRLAKLEKLAAERNDAEARHEAGELAAKLANEPEPALPRLIVDDATSEKLGMLLYEQGGRIASMSPEGGVFDLMAGLYSKGGIPQFGVYLMGHSGDDLVTDRVSRKSIHVERPALTSAYAMQPQVVEGLCENPAFRGRGLLARYLYAAPLSLIGKRKTPTPPVEEIIKERYRQLVQELADFNGECVLHLTADARDTFENWEREVEEMLADGGELETMRDWGAKLVGATARLAAVLHCGQFGPHGEIEKAVIMNAIEIARYLFPHAEAVLNMMQAKEASADDDAQYVLRWIKRHQNEVFTKRDAHQHGKRRFPKADDIDPALAELTRRGYVRLKPAEANRPGRPASPKYEVNPATLVETIPKNRSQYSHNANQSLGNLNSENSESAAGEFENQQRVQVTL